MTHHAPHLHPNMTDEHDADDGGEQVTIELEGKQALHGARATLEALGIKRFTVVPTYEVRVPAGARESDAGTLGDLTELASETEDAAEPFGVYTVDPDDLEPVEESEGEPAEPSMASGSDATREPEDDPVTFDDHDERREAPTEEDDRPECPHGCGTMVNPTRGDPLEPAAPYCTECGHIDGNDCDDGCHYDEEQVEDREEDDEGNDQAGASTDDSSPESSGESDESGNADESSDSDQSSESDGGNSTGGHATTGTTSAGNPTGASSTTRPMTEERREQLGEYPDGIFTLDHSEAGKQVYGAIANTNREWAAVPEIPIGDDDLPGDTPVNTVARHMWRGGILDRRELEGRTVRRCTYEYRIAPGKRGAGE